jgi:hypothetical protein
MEKRPRVSSLGASGILTEIALSNNNRRLMGTEPIRCSMRGADGPCRGRGVPA